MLLVSLTLQDCVKLSNECFLEAAAQIDFSEIKPEVAGQLLGACRSAFVNTIYTMENGISRSS